MAQIRESLENTSETKLHMAKMRHAKTLFMLKILLVILTEVIATTPPGTPSTATTPATITTTTKIPCPPGKFSDSAAVTSTSSSVMRANSCIAHTKCSPGKYTKAAGSTTTQPTCETCATGFFKAYESISSTCAGAASRDGMAHYYLSLWDELWRYGGVLKAVLY